MVVRFARSRVAARLHLSSLHAVGAFLLPGKGTQMASAYELVRVEDPSTGHQYTTSRAHAESAGLTVLKGKKAANSRGKALRALPRTTKGREPAPRPKAQPKTEEKDS
mgnify:CR=1 FL=1